MNIPLVLLAGGSATRLYPVTKKIPKSLIEVAGRPFLDWQIDLLKEKGIKKMIICAGNLGEQIVDYAGNGAQYGISIDYSFDGDVLLGTGGAIINAFDKLPENFFVMYGDSYLNIDFQSVNKYFESRKNPALMTVLKNRNKWDRSNVVYKDGRILVYDKDTILEGMDYIDYGLGILTKKACEPFREKGKFDLSELFSDLAKKNQLLGYEVDFRFYEIGSFDGLKETDDYLKSKK